MVLFLNIRTMLNKPRIWSNNFDYLKVKYIILNKRFIIYTNIDN